MTDEEKEAATKLEKEEEEAEKAELAKAADALKDAFPEEEFIPAKPKTRISIEFSRSGFM